MVVVGHHGVMARHPGVEVGPVDESLREARVLETGGARERVGNGRVRQVGGATGSGFGDVDVGIALERSHCSVTAEGWLLR